MLLLRSETGNITLADDTLVFALDDTGNESLTEVSYPVFGLGGCAFMVGDYVRLIEKPFTGMLRTHFPDVKRPFHITDVVHEGISKQQIQALNDFFENHHFFRLARTVSAKRINLTDLSTIEIITGALSNAIRDIAKWTSFKRVVVLVEASERDGSKIVQGLSGRRLVEDGNEYVIEVGTLPKKAAFPALEVADIIIHTAGRQVRHRFGGKADFLPDFESVFKTVDEKFISYMEFTKAEFQYALSLDAKKALKD